MTPQTPENTVTDPVCGMTIAPDSAAATREVAGQTYYFCSARCAASFDEDPARYAAMKDKGPRHTSR